MDDRGDGNSEHSDQWLNRVLRLGEKAKEVKDTETARELRAMSMRYQRVFSGHDGQTVLWDILEQTYLFFPYLQQNAGSYVKEGRREIGLFLLARMGFTPDPNSLRRLAESLASISTTKGDTQ